jgi:hypothetical protein
VRDRIDLAETQQLLWALISAPEGAEAGARGLHTAGRVPEQSLAFLVRPHGELAPVERVDVYANMYFYRLHDCLAEDYPALAAELGPAHFHNLVTDYLLAHPSRHYSLRELGRALPGFLESHPLAGAHPGLRDLASLEWARVDVFDATDAPALTRDEILARGAAEPEAFRLKAIPALQVLELAPGVLQRWRATAGGEPEERERPRDAASETVAVRVWRTNFSVWHRSIEADEAACLRQLRGPGATLGELGELLLAAAAIEGDEERAMRRLAALLETWAADAIVSA